MKPLTYQNLNQKPSAFSSVNDIAEAYSKVLIRFAQDIITGVSKAPKGTTCLTGSKFWRSRLHSLRNIDCFCISENLFWKKSKSSKIRHRTFMY